MMSPNTTIDVTLVRWREVQPHPTEQQHGLEAESGHRVIPQAEANLRGIIVAAP